ncbi:MAG: AmmeMemoRadiSam system protein B [Chlorobi bacterium]|nr:AmmeMemoRadiSam system protein B [Chlorobiota bacterium]
MKHQNQNRTFDRSPAVAGQFYPANKSELRDTITALFKRAKSTVYNKNVRAIICPHAGYVFSGEVAASGFNQINPNKKYENIFVIGSSHRIYFDGASIYNVGNYLLPLGTVKVNTSLASKLIDENKCFTFREDAHAQEHSLEVQLPFLQYIMQTDFQIIPIIIGTQTESKIKEIANALKPYFNSNNLFIISTDFSHYPEYKDAVTIDKLTAEAVLKNNPSELLKTLRNNENKHISNLVTSMCGWTSVLTLLYLTEDNPEFSYHLIEYKNSGDNPVYGDHDRVVGYNSIVVTEEDSNKDLGEEFKLSKKDKNDLIKIARSTINEYVNKNKTLEIDTCNFSENLKMHVGAFVTLREEGNLRGCIGRFNPDIELYKVVQNMAIAAATQDYRFSPVEPKELSKIEIEISALSPLKKINSIDEIVLGKHGIYIVKNGKSGTFLPGVATSTGWTLEEFLGHCARDKAGLGWNGWKDADIYIYEATVFEE